MDRRRADAHRSEEVRQRALSHPLRQRERRSEVAQGVVLGGWDEEELLRGEVRRRREVEQQLLLLLGGVEVLLEAERGSRRGTCSVVVSLNIRISPPSVHATATYRPFSNLLS